ncbi:glycosyltransferase family 2 protein [Foetidibacter luteolus]|uniref:glycosyltransferase family 2 protein n=1 Tax=Foetidibacter luteolus TaxID=2608880 RepID=UPI00129B1AF8|nr:glycosyltransferase family 2 protein [Foetidibacter luteolus]
MLKLSVVIITFNEEKNIGRCVQSVKNVADEIIVLDSYSTDTTAAIAESHGAKVFYQAFLGHIAQKNAAIAKALYGWVLSLDADEALSPQLEQEILQVKKSAAYSVYRMPRFTNYCGKWIRHCGWYPDKKIRLFDKSKGAWVGENPHDYWQPFNADEETGNLAGDILHYSYYTLSDHIKQIEKFTEIAAHAAVAKGKDCSLLKIWLGPKWKFFSDYIIRKGFLDGYEGYLICRYSAWASFAKYSKIRQYAKLKRNNSEQ